MSQCSTEIGQALEQLVQDWMRRNGQEIAVSVVEDPANLDFVIRLRSLPIMQKQLPGTDITLPLSEPIRQDIQRWLQEATLRASAL